VTEAERERCIHTVADAADLVDGDGELEPCVGKRHRDSFLPDKEWSVWQALYFFSSSSGLPTCRHCTEEVRPGCPIETAPAMSPPIAESRPMTPHMLRQSTGYKLANDGHDTRSLAHYLGHRNLQSTVTLRWRLIAPRILGRLAL